MVYCQISYKIDVPKHLISLMLLHFYSSFLKNFYKTDPQNHPSKMDNQWGFKLWICALAVKLCTVKTFKMSPKTFLNNSAILVQLLYIASHSLKNPKLLKNTTKSVPRIVKQNIITCIVGYLDPTLLPSHNHIMTSLQPSKAYLNYSFSQAI